MSKMTTAGQSRRLSGVRLATLCGMSAGPFFLIASMLQMPLYEEFDLTKHPFSFLSIGEFGWIQQAVFVVTGCLYIASAPAFARGLGGRPGRWGAALAVMLGGGKVIAGLFVVDPAFGFPAGAPAGAPEQISTGSTLHGAGFAVSMLAWLGLLVLASRRLRRVGEHAWARGSVAIAVALFTVPPLLMATEFGTVVLYVVLPVAYLFTTALLRRLVALPAA